MGTKRIKALTGKQVSEMIELKKSALGSALVWLDTVDFKATCMFGEGYFLNVL